MADTDIVFAEFYYAADQVVSVSICGLDCGDYRVSDGGIVTVPINADPDQLCNGANLAQYDVGPYDTTTYGDATTRLTIADGFGGVQTIYVPVVIGFAYPSMGQGVRPVAEDQIKSPQGPGLGKTRRVHWFGALLQNTQGIAFGTNFGGPMDGALLADEAGNKHAGNQPYSGVWAKPLDDNPSFDGQMAWQVLRPYPCTVVALSGFLETNER